MEIFLTLLAGLCLFLFAVSSLSDTLKNLLGDKARKWIAFFTKNTFTGVLTGTLITIILDSSSAVIILTIVLVNSKALTFQQSLGIVLGANIGTTFSSQLIALDIGKYSPIPIFIGLVLSFISRKDSISKSGKSLLYFGIMFFGLYTMERAVEPLRAAPGFMDLMTRLENPLKGAGIGAAVTLILQSSSATVGMVITLAKKELISLSAGIAVMLGAELGTCSDTLLATLKSNRQAVKTGLFHLMFNLTSIIIGIILFPWFVSFIKHISGGAGMEQQIANAHMMFNIGGVLLFSPFVPLISKLLNKLLPDSQVSKPSISLSEDRSAADNLLA
jgi:phosphate:Na+ symporter